MSESASDTASALSAAPPAEVVAAPARSVWTAADRSERITNAVLSLCGLLVLAVAISLEPSGAGHGTHQQLGLPPCSFLQMTGIPCLSCGMTTSFAHTVRGQFVGAFKAQPFGFFLALCTIVAVPLLAWSSWSGRSLASWMGQWRWRLWGPMLLVGLLAAWGYKIVEIRMHG